MEGGQIIQVHLAIAGVVGEGNNLEGISDGGITGNRGIAADLNVPGQGEILGEQRGGTLAISKGLPAWVVILSNSAVVVWSLGAS